MDASERILLANAKCSTCHGLGGRVRSACCCVYRNIFRICLRRYHACLASQHAMGSVRLTFGRSERFSYARPSENFIADFTLVARRTLDEFEFDVFRMHFLEGQDWRAVARALMIDRGSFFHAVYRIQAKAGRAFRELEPYGLFPIQKYFGERTVPDQPMHWGSQRHSQKNIFRMPIPAGVDIRETNRPVYYDVPRYDEPLAFSRAAA